QASAHGGKSSPCRHAKVEVVRVSVLLLGQGTEAASVEAALRAAGHWPVADGPADLAVLLAADDAAPAAAAELRARRPGTALLALTPTDAPLDALLAAGVDDHLCWPR